MTPVAFSLRDVQLAPGRHVIDVAGEIDVYTAPELRARVREALAREGTDLVIDLSGTTFLDSAALGTLMDAARSAEAGGGRLVIVSTDESIARTLEITGLDQILSVLSTRAQALSALDEPAPA